MAAEAPTYFARDGEQVVLAIEDHLKEKGTTETIKYKFIVSVKIDQDYVNGLLSKNDRKYKTDIIYIDPVFIEHTKERGRTIGLLLNYHVVSPSDHSMVVINLLQPNFLYEKFSEKKAKVLHYFTNLILENIDNVANEQGGITTGIEGEFRRTSIQEGKYNYENGRLDFGDSDDEGMEVDDGGGVVASKFIQCNTNGYTIE